MIGLSPLSPGHRRRFQPTCVRPSTGSYPRFSLPRDSSPGFASAAADSDRPVRTRFRSGSLTKLNLADGRQLAGSFYKRHAVTPPRVLRRLAGARFQVLFHSPPGVLFTFPSRYLCAIGHRRVFRLGGWSPRVRTGFHVPGPTQGPPPGSIRGCAYGALTLCRRPSHAVRLPWMDARRERQLPGGRPCNPGGGIGWRPPARRFGHRPPFARRYSGDLAVDFFSSGYLDVSVPRVVPLPAMCSPGGCQDFSWRVRPFGDPRVEGCVPLTADYRSLPRPSSASCAKASAVRPTYLPAPRRGLRSSSVACRDRCMGVAYRPGGRTPQAARCSSQKCKSSLADIFEDESSSSTS